MVEGSIYLDSMEKDNIGVDRFVIQDRINVHRQMGTQHLNYIVVELSRNKIPSCHIRRWTDVASSQTRCSQDWICLRQEIYWEKI